MVLNSPGVVPAHKQRQHDPVLGENMQNKCVFLVSVLRLNVTDDSDLPQDMIAHFCQFREFYLTLAGAQTKNNWTIRYSA